MPASRSPARSKQNSHQRMVNINAESSEARLQHARAHSNIDPGPSPPSAKRRRAPNAFILFRSFMIASRLIPPEVTHQNDVSRYVAEKWRAMSPSDRGHFFRMADERKMSLEAGPPVNATKDRPTAQHRSSTLQGTDVQSASSCTFPLGAYAENDPAPATFASVSGHSRAPVAPQPIRAIPPDLLQWDQDHSLDLTAPNMPEVHGTGFSPSYSAWSSEYEFDAGIFGFGDSAPQSNSAPTSGVDELWQAFLDLDVSASFPNECSFHPNPFAYAYNA